MHLEYRDEALATGADAFVGKGEPADRLLAVLSAVADADLSQNSSP
jgi:DNA-binding NarL/FixJ family response regulator